MESMRQQKMARQIQKDLGELFLKNSRDYFGNHMVTLTQVKVTPDLGQAYLYLSIFPNENAETFFENLEHKKGEIKRHLGNKMSSRARKIPDISFFHDEVDEQAAKMDKLINSLNIPPKKEE